MEALKKELADMKYQRDLARLEVQRLRTVLQKVFRSLRFSDDVTSQIEKILVNANGSLGEPVPEFDKDMETPPM